MADQQQSQKEPRQQVCPACNSRIDWNARVCPVCGHKFADVGMIVGFSVLGGVVAGVIIIAVVAVMIYISICGK